MGIAIVDDRASGGGLKEYNTTTCVHYCGSVIIYQSKPIGGFLRKVRTTHHPVLGRIEEIGEGFYCQRHGGDICKFCGDNAFKGMGPCISGPQLAEATITALAHGVPIYTREGREYIKNLATRKVY